MQADKHILPALAGTGMMTAFSYLVSDLRNKNFREPALLAGLLKNSQHPKANGWKAHFLVGICWSPVLRWMIKKVAAGPVFSTMVAGGISGAVAVLAWKAAFSLHPSPPSTDYKHFYRHLVFAHFVFSLPFIFQHFYTAPKSGALSQDDDHHAPQQNTPGQ